MADKQRNISSSGKGVIYYHEHVANNQMMISYHAMHERMERRRAGCLRSVNCLLDGVEGGELMSSFVPHQSRYHVLLPAISLKLDGIGDWR